MGVRCACDRRTRSRSLVRSLFANDKHFIHTIRLNCNDEWAYAANAINYTTAEYKHNTHLRSPLFDNGARNARVQPDTSDYNILLLFAAYLIYNAIKLSVQQM